MHCIDDMMTAEPSEFIPLAYLCWRRLAALVGWNIPDEKSPPPAWVFRLLGIEIDFSNHPEGAPMVRIVEERYWKIMKFIHQVESEKSLVVVPLVSLQASWALPAPNSLADGVKRCCALSIGVNMNLIGSR